MLIRFQAFRAHQTGSIAKIARGVIDMLSHRGLYNCSGNNMALKSAVSLLFDQLAQQNLQT
jgi:hypothetical protein